MDNNTYIFNFTFTPKKLVETRKSVQKRYEDIDLLTASQISGMRLPKLLELIRGTPETEIESLATQLKKTDIMVLLYQFPHQTESNETQKKINLLICHRYSSTIGNYVWGIFQHEFQNVFVQDLLRRCFAVDQFGFLDLSNSKLIDGMKAALINRSGINKGLVELLRGVTVKVEHVLKAVKIKADSPLENHVLYNMLLEGMHSDEMIRRDGEGFICQLLDRYPIHDYQQVMKVYLEARNHNQFHSNLLEQAIVRLHDPRERIADWEFLSEQAMQQVQRWLLEIELKKFFEGDVGQRFEYWKRYLHYIKDVIQLKGRNDPKVAFIYFENIVVVEFGNIGAAYFYHKAGFNKFILSKTTGTEFSSRSVTAKESLLKNMNYTKNGEPLYIHKLGHHGFFDTWTAKFTRHMQEYMDGYYDYAE
ncbi:hypothetical protein [Paenibacillus soyae]|uniref:Zorya protein ZorC EH domain-containing protein n=1 Tax=Paenibacillus soyae TaxID=2969249 RepID=A0A9X2MTH4_9BACL|nr:hypothetical protein [Paenibacillus soyae]MCR2807718.1 hypothetical protein [Paenibacillus soyae]